MSAKTPWTFQHSFQAVITILIAVAIYLNATRAARRNGTDLRAEAQTQLPLE
ncbi:MAG: hypothetical protein ABSD96_02850 [Candidatus Korobacteraceae bacterium]